MANSKLRILTIIIIAFIVSLIVIKMNDANQYNKNLEIINKLKDQKFSQYFNFLLEDDSFGIFTLNVGEWGDAAIFVNKSSGYIYSYNIRQLSKVEKIDKEYLLIGEEMIDGEFVYKKKVIVSNPEELNKIPTDVFNLASIDSFSGGDHLNLWDIAHTILKQNKEFALKNLSDEENILYQSNKKPVTKFQNDGQFFAEKQNDITNKLNDLVRTNKKYLALDWYETKKDSLTKKLKKAERTLFYIYLDSLRYYSHNNNEIWNKYMRSLQLEDSLLSNNSNVRVVESLGEF